MVEEYGVVRQMFEDLLTRLRGYRLPALNLGDEFVYPNYAGYSILNLPSSVCRWLDVTKFGVGPLAHELTDPLGDGIQRIILVLMDALSLHRIERWLERGSAPAWKELAERGMLAPLTSITPSTTSAALTSLWTGRSAVEHGILGYELWLKEYGLVANTILHAPIAYKNAAGSLAQAGFNPETFMSLPTLGQHLTNQGVSVYAFQHHGIARSGLSKMLFKSVKVQPFNTAADLWVSLRQLVEKHSQEMQYIWVYWSEVDTFSHRYGPDDEHCEAEFASFSQAFERLFLDRLPSTAIGSTLIILTADHGQIATRQDPHYELRNHPSLTRRLHILPSGENRLAYFFTRPGQVEAVQEYLERVWPNQFYMLDPVYAIEAGLFGPGMHHPRLYDRLGDFVVVARRDAYLWWADKDNPLFGRHGGLHPDEMLVPFLAARL